MWTNLMFFYYADNLKVSTIVSIFFCENSKLALKLRICVRLATIFLCGACDCPYNDLVICKDSSDCLTDRYTHIVQYIKLTSALLCNATVGNTTVFHGRYSLFEPISYCRPNSLA